MQKRKVQSIIKKIATLLLKTDFITKEEYDISEDKTELFTPYCHIFYHTENNEFAVFLDISVTCVTAAVLTKTLCEANIDDWTFDVYDGYYIDENNEVLIGDKAKKVFLEELTTSSLSEDERLMRGFLKMKELSLKYPVVGLT